MSFKFSISSFVGILTAGKALASDLKALYDLVGEAMDTVEKQYAGITGAGADKKTAVLNIVSLAAAELNKDFGPLAAEVSAIIDGAKSLYNAVVKAVTSVAPQP